MSIDKKALLNRLLVSLLMGFGLYIVISVYDTMVISNGNYYEAIYNTIDIGVMGIATIIALIFLSFICIYHSDFIFKYRFIIAFFIFIICVILGINGSSIECVNDSFESKISSSILFGSSREIRSDEWALLTPLTMSQYFGNKFSYFSNIVRATSTDVFIEYGTPVKSLIMIFRPFQIGYLFLPFANGLAFFWCGRAIALFMTSFEFGRLITKDNRKLSLVYGVMVVLAPAVQWWFAINGFVEMLIFSQLSIILLKKYMLTNNYVIRTVCALVISICAGGYVLTMYPSWMVPLAYLIVLLAIWVIIDNYKKCKMTLKDITIIAIAFVIFAAGMEYVFVNSFDTIKTIMSTAYPGKRFEVGGGSFKDINLSVTNIWYSIYYFSPDTNVCENSSFISLFPLGLILYILYLIKNRKNDWLATFMTVLSVFLFIWCSFGFPTFLAKITFMSLSQASRAVVIFEFVSLLLLIRTLYLWSMSLIKERYILVVSLITTVVIVGLSFYYYHDYEPIRFIWIITLIVFGIFIFSLLSLNKKYSRLAIIYILIFMFVTSGFVNPIRLGSNDVTEIDELQAVSDIVEMDSDAIWAIEDEMPLINTLLMVGARSINSTNVYPDLDKWSILDSTREYDYIYNRYAHITIELVDDESEANTFELLYPDAFKLNITIDQMRLLNIKYLFTKKEHNIDDLVLINQINDYYIYEVNN